MIPIVTPAEMAAVDAAAPEPVEVLVDRAGSAVAWTARRFLGGCYGRRVVVVAGPGNNGADGRVAAQRLRRWGTRVDEVAPDAPAIPDGIDLVIDAAFGTGLSRPYTPPATSAPVLAVDIPSGVNGLTGELAGDPYSAELTVTFQALKPGLLLHPGAARCGTTTVADIGLDVSRCRAHLVQGADVTAVMPRRAPTAHKWRAATWVIAGSAGMTGAATLASSAASRAGAGYVRLSVPGAEIDGPIEAVGHALDAGGWAGGLTDVGRFGSVVVGPGLGRDRDTSAAVVEMLARTPVPVVVDGDALAAVAADAGALAERAHATILTPHDGEFELIAGSPPDADRVAAARGLASRTGAIVLLKGPATVVAEPDGVVRVVNSGDARLATAGSGDVLAGVIGALVCRGMGAFDAAWAGAWVHGRAATLAPREGMIASDLLATLPEVLDETHLG